MKHEVQNKFGGVNQRNLRFEALDFFTFDGCWPQWAGIQSRINGKSLLELSTSPVLGIYQTWTPFGYSIGYNQTYNNLSTDPWLVAPFNINTAPLALVDINEGGYVLGPLSGASGSNSTSGLGGGTGASIKYRLTHTDYDIAPYISNLKYFTGTYSNSRDLPLMNFVPFPPLPYLALVQIPATTQTTSPSNDLVASQDATSTNQIRNGGPFPNPFNNNFQTQSWASSSIDTTANLDITSLLASNVILITILATVNTTAATEIPISNSLTFDDIKANPILTIKTSDYIIPATISQSSEYGPTFFSIQSQESGVLFNKIRVYSNVLTHA